MFKPKYLGLLGLIAASLFATQAFATICPTTTLGVTQGSPVCIATVSQDGAGKNLQDQLNNITTSGPKIDVYNGQTSPSAYWQIASGTSTNEIVMEIAGNAGANTFGIFDPKNPSNYIQLFDGRATTGWTNTLVQSGNVFKSNFYNPYGKRKGGGTMTLSGNTFGYYLGAASKTPSFYSDPTMNAPDTTYTNGMPHMTAYAGNGTTYLNNEQFALDQYLLAWDDTVFSKSDLDYNDFVVLVKSVHPVSVPVPEPAVLGMFGLGLLLICGFELSRRRRYNV
jgi:hypothetical protein